MKILVFGDPEGILQRKKKFIKKILEKSNPDLVIFLGDYYSTQRIYYNKLLRYKITKSLFDLFPESILVKSIENLYKYVFVFGNKDIKSSLLGLHTERAKKKLDNWYFIQENYGEINDIGTFILNGSYVINVDEKLNKAYNYILELKEKYNVKSLLMKAKKHVRIKIINEFKQKFGKRYFDLIFGCYLTNFENIDKIKTKYEILLTHTPPNLKNSKLIFGNYPDLAIYKKEKGTGIVPVYEKDSEAIKENVGEEKITRFILRNNFRLVLCGRVHEGSGIAIIKKSNTIVINPGSIAAFQNKDKIIPYVILNLKETNIDIYINSWLGRKEIKLNI